MSHNVWTNRTDDFFGEGPMRRVLERYGFVHPRIAEVVVPVVCVVALTYMPLLLLAAAQRVLLIPGGGLGLLTDVSVATSFLVSAPLLVAAGGVIEPWVVRVLVQVRRRILVQSELDRLDRSSMIAKRFRDQHFVMIVIGLVAFGWQFVENGLSTVGGISWQTDMHGNATSAFVWYSFFAKPLLRFLWLRWLWRYAIWLWFLWRLAFLKLDIIAPHPDGRGGLSFIARAQDMFAVLVIAFSAQAAGVVANQVLYEHKALSTFGYEVVGLLAIVLVIFLAPLLPFTPALVVARRQALVEYGAFADAATRAFQGRFLSRERDSFASESGESEATLSDVYRTYNAVQAMQNSLITRRELIIYIVATLVPFVPLLVTIYPVQALAKQLLKVIF